jgi:hypothetical protein
MIRTRTRVGWTVALVTAAVVASGLFAYAADWAFYTYTNWHQIQLSRCDTPVIRSFARDEFGPGDAIASLTDIHPPGGSVRHGKYTTYFYESKDGELWVTAREGRLVSAHLGGYKIRGFTFFDARTHPEAQECCRSREKVLTERWAVFVIAGFAGAGHARPE